MNAIRIPVYPRSRLTAGLLLAAGLACWALPAAAQQAYPTPDAAGEALVSALGTTKADPAKVSALMGADWKDYIPDGSIGRADVDAFLQKYQQSHATQKQKDGRTLLVVGKDPWTFPVPLVKGTGGWHFDLKAGADEIRARRIGRDELDVVQALRAYDDAQQDYAEVDRDGDGVLEYAQKLVSTDGLHDGLYWADDDSGQVSPLGPLFGDDSPHGDWLGYRYRILTSQGPSAPGGAYSFMLGKDMSRGFALVAWPAKYRDTGVMSFMISHDGQVFQKDLGKNGEGVAKAMASFDPDSGWQPVADSVGADDTAPATQGQ